MKRSLKTKALALVMSLAFVGFTFAQTAMKATSISISLTGTSTLHDWEMKSAAASSDAAFVTEGQKLDKLARLSFVLPVKNLKSHSKAMDNNTYKALNTDDHQNIQFVLTASSVTPAGGNNYNIKAVGKLTIAGTTKDTELLATGTYNPADGSLTINGSKKMKMTDFNVKPPTVMMGTIKTGNDITIAYNLKFTK